LNTAVAADPILQPLSQSWVRYVAFCCHWFFLMLWEYFLWN